MLVREAMTSTVVTVTLQTSVKAALRLLAEHGITAMPVVDRSERLRGIVSELDLIESTILHDPRASERPITLDATYPPRTVEDVYTRAAVTVAPEDDVATAVELMTATGAKSLPVVEPGHRLIGLISRSDVVRALARSDDAVAADISRVLTSVGYADWLVEVDDGVAVVTGPADLGQESLAKVVAHTVAGVTDVRIGQS